jgi:CheY-like chemotaxis protein
MPAGGQIRVKSYARASHVVVEVTDTGCGMSEEQRQRCFEPFYTTKGDRGTGLGLSICQEITLDHGGRLEVESEYGQGSTFRVLFPVEGQASTEELLPNIVSLLPWRILYVDDDKRSRQVVRRLLEFLRQEVDVADDSVAALQLFRKTRYDMVLTDLTMPNVNGITFTREIRQIHHGIPVVLLTGWMYSLASLGGPAESRPDAVLQKPLTVQALRNVLEQIQRGSAAD